MLADEVARLSRPAPRPSDDDAPPPPSSASCALADRLRLGRRIDEDPLRESRGLEPHAARIRGATSRVDTAYTERDPITAARVAGREDERRRRRRFRARFVGVGLPVVALTARQPERARSAPLDGRRIRRHGAGNARWRPCCPRRSEPWRRARTPSRWRRTGRFQRRPKDDRARHRRHATSRRPRCIDDGSEGQPLELQDGAFTITYVSVPSRRLALVAKDAFGNGDEARTADPPATGVQRALVRGKRIITRAVPGAAVRTMALPLGVPPRPASRAVRGRWEGETYRHDGVFLVRAGPAPSPFSRAWRRTVIPRIKTGPWHGGEPDFASGFWLDVLRRHPERRYVSDGDPSHIFFPRKLAPQLAPRLRSGRTRTTGAVP